MHVLKQHLPTPPPPGKFSTGFDGVFNTGDKMTFTI